jgi:hypothetical protein
MLRPNALEIIRGIQVSLLTHVAPEVQSAYARAQVQYALGLLQMLAEEWDVTPQRLMEENRSLRALFREAAEAVQSVEGTGGLARRLEEAAAADDGDLTISALSARNQDLQALLAELMEVMDAPDAGDTAPLERLRGAVRRELRAHVERRPSRLPGG